MSDELESVYVFVAEIDLVSLWGIEIGLIEIDLVSLWGIEIGLISVYGSELTWFGVGIENDLV